MLATSPPSHLLPTTTALIWASPSVTWAAKPASSITSWPPLTLQPASQLPHSYQTELSKTQLLSLSSPLQAFRGSQGRQEVMKILCGGIPSPCGGDATWTALPASSFTIPCPQTGLKQIKLLPFSPSPCPRPPELLPCNALCLVYSLPPPLQTASGLLLILQDPTHMPPPPGSLALVLEGSDSP